MSENLTFCPCCGNHDVRIMEKYYQAWTPLYYAVCTSCGMRTSEFREKEEAIKRWNKRVLSWIKTSDRLPEWDKEVLGLKYDGSCDVIWWNGEAWGYRDMNYLVLEYVDKDKYPYWMPLPEPPEVEE